MAANTKIPWCDHTWNPFYGCPDDGKRTTACDNCYARAWARRSGIVNFDQEIKRASDKTFHAPLNRKKYLPGDKVFVCSLSDFFHEAVPDSLFAEAWDVVNARPDLIWLFLTKRPENISSVYNWAPYDPGGDQHNHWLGVTVESDEQLQERGWIFRGIQAAKKFYSMEPLLSSIHFYRGRVHFLYGIDWVICGGESGSKARPMHPDWARSLRDQCAAADVPFFFKQWGEWSEVYDKWVKYEATRNELASVVLLEPDGRATPALSLPLSVQETHCHEWDCWMRRVGKKEAGRLLDGRAHSEFPRG